MSTNLDESQGIPPPPQTSDNSHHVPPFWTNTVQTEKIYDHLSRLCEGIFEPGKVIKHNPPKGCTYGKTCSFAHSLSKLQPPGGYQQNQPLPPDAPQDLCVFHCTDWGSRHREYPVFEFPFESTFPTKVTRHVLQLLAGGGRRIQESMAPGELPFRTILCYSYTFYQKCPYWQNCNYLHVQGSVIKERCRRYKCQVNGNRTCCKFKKCPYAHDTRDLTIHPDMETPAFDAPDGDYLRQLTLTAENGIHICSQFNIKQKYIARTRGCNSLYMCNSRWCTVTDEAQCMLAHLLPCAWLDDAFQNVDGVKPPIPRYFQKYLPHAARAQQASVPNHWSTAAGSKSPSPQTRPCAAPEADFPALGLDFPALGSPLPTIQPNMKRKPWQGKQPLAIAGDIDHKIPNSNSGSPEPVQQRTISSQGELSPDTSADLSADVFDVDTASEDSSPDFLTLLDLPTFKAFTPTRLPKLPDYQSLVEKWDRGVSTRFHAHYHEWLNNGQMNKKFLEHGGVLTHSQINSQVGEGFAASVWLGITVSDGREVALKVFRPQPANDQQQKDQLARHFRQEMMALKRHGGLPGTVQYLGSFQCPKENEDEGLCYYQNVVILELMEGTLQEAVTNWAKDAIGTVEHLRLVRYVLGSMLAVLEQLNYGQFQSLVHRDVKPDNIMVDRYKNIRLIDFGISRVVDKVKESTKVSVSDGTAVYTSPEAQKQLPEAHITSDLYSLGMVVHFLLIGRDPGFVRNSAADLVPRKWPEYHRVALQHLHKELVKLDPNERAMHSIARSTNTPHHRILLSHPFFWSARKGISFLVALGNFTAAPIPGLSDAVKLCYEDKGWFPSVEEYESPSFPVTREDKQQPWGLLRFIRNQHTHATDRGINKSVMHPLLAKPVILERFPRLVLECWAYLVGHSRLISHEFPTMASYFRSGWDAQAIRNPDEEPSWS